MPINSFEEKGNYDSPYYTPYLLFAFDTFLNYLYFKANLYLSLVSAQWSFKYINGNNFFLWKLKPLDRNINKYANMYCLCVIISISCIKSRSYILFCKENLNLSMWCLSIMLLNIIFIMEIWFVFLNTHRHPNQDPLTTHT